MNVDFCALVGCGFKGNRYCPNVICQILNVLFAIIRYRK